ncbi:MAG: YdeI/OmpD-associated family protein [Aggregatilineales bacterium]
MVWWVISAKKDETKRKQLAQLIQDSERGCPLPRPLSHKRERGGA